MSDKSQLANIIIGEKKGIPIYKSNPSIPQTSSIGKRRKTQYGDEKKGFVVDTESGELISMGGVSFYEFEEVDDTRFVKMFLAGIKQTAGLTKSGLTLFEVIYKYLQNRPGEDKIIMSYYSASEEVKGLTERTYQRGLRELLNKKFLFRSPSDGVFFVNIRYMFNGDRLAFVKGYQRKRTSQDSELPLFQKS